MRRLSMACRAQPILIGHSFGGLIAEKLLGMDRGAAAIAIDAVSSVATEKRLTHFSARTTIGRRAGPLKGGKT